MKTAEDRSNYFIWYVIDRIMEMTLPEGLHEVTYYLNVNIRRKEPIPFLDERNSLHFLLKNHAIELIDDIGHTENDKKGTPEYVVEEMYRLKLGKKWNEFYDRYKKKFESSGKDKLLFSKSGAVVFCCDGYEYKAVFNPKTNMYKALFLLASKQPEIMSFETIDSTLERKKLNTESTEENRARQVIRDIKRKLKYKGKRLFCANFGFGLIPEAEIKSGNSTE